MREQGLVPASIPCCTKARLCRFRGICHDFPAAPSASYSKQRSCLSCFFCFSRQILQIFTGNCESHSSEKGPPSAQVPRRITRVRLYQTFPASCLHCGLNSKERPNEDPTEDAGDAGACLGIVCRTGTDNSARDDRYNNPQTHHPESSGSKKAFAGEPD